MKFDEAMAKLEKIARSLEDADISVEDALALYEEGIKLVKLCRKKLVEIEKKIELITEDDSGNVRRKKISEKELLEEESLGEE
ncbi:MAG: exodeoxyribonuclease VII small subunit [Candidatus Omnitrophica bacterium]|nr:exodeoxyribonuclease VII small subunit [Candidatus Omnitrophota bacterium]